MYFQYGETELNYLKSRDVRMCALIEKVGRVQRTVDCELFSAVVHQIVGQQISTKAMETVWNRVRNSLGVIDAQTVLSYGTDNLQALGISYRKADYITQFAQKVACGELNLNGLWTKSDDEIIKELSALKGVGVWTAEMILLFCMQRPNVLSYNDLAIQRGLKMVYGHKSISRELFEKYRRRFSPYCSVASLYLWAAAGGAVEGLKDYAPKKHKLTSAK